VNTNKHMILKNGEDITCDVTFCKYNSCEIIKTAYVSFKY
jgi:hypothetical protein